MKGDQKKVSFEFGCQKTGLHIDGLFLRQRFELCRSHNVARANTKVEPLPDYITPHTKV